MSFRILTTGASALTTAQRAVETAAHNAANSTSPGYTRQRVTTAATVPAQGADGVAGSGHLGTGVRVVSIDRLRDVLGDLAVRAEEATAGSAQVRAEVLDRAQTVLGPYGSGVSDALSKMFAAFDQLALTPNSPAARQIVLEQAQSFAAGLNEAAATLDRIRRDASLQAASEVQQVNDLAAEIANLNTHIVAATNGGQQPNDLLDRRDLLVDELSGLVGAVSRTRPDGAVDIRIGSAPLVQSGVAFPVELRQDTQVSGDLAVWMHGHPVRVGGELGGRVDVLATDLRTIERQLDELAAAVATGVNGVHEAGHHSPTGTGQAFFAGTTAAGLRLAEGLTIDTIAAARIGGAASTYSEFNGENALQLAKLRATGIPLTPGGLAHTPGEWLNQVTSTLASRASAAMAASETAQTSLTSLRAQRESLNGVSIDEEMIELVKFQHSYDAAARVISIADEMLNTIINRMGAGR